MAELDNDSPSSAMADLNIDDDDDRFEELSDEDAPDLVEAESAESYRPPPVPALYTTIPPLHDALVTESSKLMDQTHRECLPYLKNTMFKTADFNSHGVPKLRRAKHINFAKGGVEELPSYFVMLDASRPWIIHWTTASLSMLGVDLAKEGYRERAVDTFRACQNESGGFGGSHGQWSHLACTYAALLSLVTVGGEEAYDMIDRRAMWRYLGRMKQPDGGFTMCAGGEEDVRGAFCAMVIASLLNLPLKLPPEEVDRVGGDGTLLGGLAEWVSRCGLTWSSLNVHVLTLLQVKHSKVAWQIRQAMKLMVRTLSALLDVYAYSAHLTRRSQSISTLICSSPGYLIDRQCPKEASLAAQTNLLTDAIAIGLAAVGRCSKQLSDPSDLKARVLWTVCGIGKACCDIS